MVTTRDRGEDALRCVDSALSQSAPVEVVVIDDASADQTGEAIASRFPEVRTYRTEERRGLIANRNWAAQLASTPFLFSIDDDAVFSSTHVVEQTLELFDESRVGAVAIPFCNVKIDDKIRQQAPCDEQCWVVNEYIGTAHAIRRDMFLRLGGYREHFIHQGEEGDFCIRLLAEGYVVRLGSGDPVHHFVSPRRSVSRMDVFGRRNGILFAWHNVPRSLLPAVLVGTTVQGIRHAVRTRRYRHNLAGLICGYAACLKYWRERRPVSREVYRLFRRLRRRQAPLAQIEGIWKRGSASRKIDATNERC